VVFATIESGRLGWSSPVILGLLAVAVLSMVGIVAYELRRTDPLLELRLFRSVPFSSAILMAMFALCGFSAFLFVTTQYLQSVRGMSALTAGLSLLPVGGLIAFLSPYTGRLVAASGPRIPLLVSGSALALGGLASLWLTPGTPMPAVLAIFLFFGLFLGTGNPPITNTAVSGMPRSMAGVATSLISAARQTGTTMGVGISGTIVGAAVAHGGSAYTDAEQGVWWLAIGLGVAMLALCLLSTGRWAKGTATRAAALFEEVDRGAAVPEAAPAPR
jgi:predicted MFS family arabinose efflux permease